ncbi:hypothetical protein TanjilG_20332 [Lupinus angustifolius]|uniref:TIR domain-containing protein n=2 Tax=Lupinus angustifolius TaxID=3871 RepID=A0A4P1RVS8_LUPAN|nr:hypothetical protein TanjilG_20332 [Lupinus angustifolius]
MSGLRLLVIKGPGHVHLSRALVSLPSSLRVLDWEGYPLKTLPSIQLDELVYLILMNSKLTQLWNTKLVTGKGLMFFKKIFSYPCFDQFIKLKVINLSHSKDLTRIQDFDGIPNLESLILAGCENLLEVHESFGKLEKLVKVDFTGCKKLKTLPSKLSTNSLQAFILSGCLKLQKLPEFGKNMQSLSMLRLEETAIEGLPPSLGFLTGLSILNLKGCKNLVSFPNTMCNLKSLRILDVSFCSKMYDLPENLGENVQLEELHADASGIRELPLCIVHLKNLKSLTLHSCKGTKLIISSLRPLPLPRSFSGLSLLRELALCYCDLSDESIPSDFSCLSSLWRLNLAGNYFVNIPIGCISKLPKLEQLNIYGCPKLRSLPVLPPNLAFVDATGCYSMEPLLDPQQLWNLFASHDFQNWHTFCLAGDFSMLIDGDEISSWFHNKNYHYEDMAQSRFDKGISIILDIPHGYLDSVEWCGIVVCLALEELSYDEDCLSSIHWSFKSPESEGIMGATSKWVGIDQKYDCPKLFIAFFPFTNSNCLQHIEDKINQQLQLTICTKRDSMLNGAPIRMHGVIGIRECGWRLLCNKDLETKGGFNASSGSAHNDRRVTKDDKCQNEFKGQQDQSQASLIVAEPPKSFFKTYS